MTRSIQHLARLAGGGLLITMSVARADAQAVDPRPASPSAAQQSADQAPHDTTPAGATLAKPITPPHPRDTLTGDWDGARTDLKDAGIDVRADYVSETFGVVRGGERRGTAYTQQIRAGLDFDLDRLAGWSGAKVHVTLNDRRGRGISSDFVGNRLPIQEAYGGQYTRLSELSYEQDLAGGTLNLRVGWFAMGNDLGGMALGCNFVNAAFCAHALSLSGDSGWYNYPNARWGAAVRYRVRSDVTLRSGVYQANARLGNERNAFRPFAGGTTGVILPAEIEYDPGATKGSHVLPGHYKLGAYYDTSRAPRQGDRGMLRGRYGVYLLADQMVLREGNGPRGLSIFGQFTANPVESAQITRWYATGLVKTGTFAGRDADTLGLGIVHAQVNPRLRRGAVDVLPITGAPIVTSYASLPAGETAIELSYGIQLRRWLSIRPDVQYIIDPGAFGLRRTRNALAFGSQVKVQF